MRDDDGKHAEALQDFSDAVGIQERLVEKEGRNELAGELAISLINRGIARASNGKLPEAVADLDRAVGIDTRRFEAGPEGAGGRTLHRSAQPGADALEARQTRSGHDRLTKGARAGH